MIVYSGTRADFTRDVFGNVIEEKILAQLKQRARHSASASEIQSWQNSMQYMNNALIGAGIPDDAGVAIEYKIPLTSKRVDFILSGLDEARNETAVIVELKQWTVAEATPKDAIVEAFVKGVRALFRTPSLLATYLGFSVYLLIRAWLFQREAADARDKIIKDLERWRIKVAEDETSVRRTNYVIEQFRAIEQGAFVPWTRHPIVQSVIIPAAGLTILRLLGLLT